MSDIMSPRPMLSRKSISSPYNSFCSFISTLGVFLLFTLSFNFGVGKPGYESYLINDILLEDLFDTDFLALSLLFIFILIIFDSDFLSSRIYSSFSADNST